MKRSICVVEPHADDAFLSLGTHMEQWIKEGIEVTIWTIYSGTRKRGRDAAAYAEAIGAAWVGSGLSELTEEPDHPRDFAWNFKRDMPNTEQIILPIAVYHTEHTSVRRHIERMPNTPEILYYLDQPYAITQKHGERVTDLLRGRRIVSYRKCGMRKFRHIPLFKDQSSFFHYNPAEKLMQTMELIVR